MCIASVFSTDLDCGIINNIDDFKHHNYAGPHIDRDLDFAFDGVSGALLDHKMVLAAR